MKQLMDIRLVQSEKMDQAGESEDGCVRIPKKARLFFDTQGERVALTIAGKTVALLVKPAFKEDLLNLRDALKNGKVSGMEARTVGFVTSRLLKSLLGKLTGDPGNAYISESIEDLTIGADPEFVLVDPATERFKYAAYVETLTKDGEFGSDGPLAEIRPAPSTSVEEVIKNITKATKQGEKLAGVYRWLAGAAYKSPKAPEDRIVHIGGHIHIGNPVLLPEAQKNGIYTQIIRILDETIAIPLVRIDTPLPHLRRNTVFQGQGRYGRWGDQRPQVGRFEWRVPSGLWLSHPDFARAVLGTSKAVAETCYQMMASKGFNEEWILAPSNKKGFLKEWGALGSKTAAQLVNDADPANISPALINRAAKKLQSMGNYEKYKNEIEEFLRLVRLSEKDRGRINLDIKQTWLNNGKLISGG